MPVTTQFLDGIAVLTIDRPPVNGIDAPTRRELGSALDVALADTAVRAIVVTGGPKLFSAGADIEEFAKGVNGPLTTSPTHGELYDRIANAAKPIVAAIGGVCMGGGLELALACHLRVAAVNAKFALPEVKLGILPGAGGTQRLPRVIGVTAALQMITTGETINTARAVELGLAQAADGELIAAAAAVARNAVGKPLPRLREVRPALPAGETADGFFGAKLAALRKPLPAVKRCIEAVRMAVELPFDAGLQREFEIFKELVQTAESRSLQYAFFSERAAARIDGVPKDAGGRRIERIAVIGAGTMGGGIAMCAINAGIPVILIDQAQAAVDRGMATMRRNYAVTVSKGRLSQADMDQRLARVTPSTQLRDVADADLIIEAVFEDMTVKQNIFREIDAAARPGAVLASNTSTLDLNVVAAATRRPSDVVGLHFFSPANVMRLLEIVRGRLTSGEVLTTAMSFSRRIGKVGVIAGVCDGFIGNRMFEEYLRQAYFLLDEGATPAQVDGAMERFGFAMGPLAVMDLAGQDIGWAIRKRRAAEHPDRPYSKIPDLICELGRFGQKTGAGFYQYDPATRARQNDPEIEALIRKYAKDQGIEQRLIGDEEIVQRCVLALANEGALLLGQGFAQRASDIDVVWLNGYGFPAYRGGPMFHADLTGLSNVITKMAEFRRGYRGEYWQVAPLLVDCAQRGTRLSAAQAPGSSS